MAVLVAEINVDVWQIGAGDVDEAFKNQPERNRINSGNAKQITNQEPQLEPRAGPTSICFLASATKSAMM
jgi:hypothetical protein